MKIDLSPPARVPDEVFGAALRCFLEPRRLDMKSLASELGISRATLYRRAPTRDALLGEIIWFLTRHASARALAAPGAGPDRVLAVIATFMEITHESQPLRRFLAEEPETALRVLTSKEHPVQRGLIGIVGELLREDAGLELPLDAETTAYLIVRIGETFLYADVIADHEPNLLAAIEVVRRILGIGGSLDLLGDSRSTEPASS